MATMHSYLVTVVDRNTLKEQQIVVESPCPHDMTPFIQSLVAIEDPGIDLQDPIVTDVNEMLTYQTEDALDAP